MQQAKARMMLQHKPARTILRHFLSIAKPEEHLKTAKQMAYARAKHLKNS